ncbi:MAG: hypothetical protein LBF88_13785, partial [Planctomycetaceae bacterium]|nr:hypothetical protein [Planctomycetaceae bacterium]
MFRRNIAPAIADLSPRTDGNQNPPMVGNSNCRRFINSRNLSAKGYLPDKISLPKSFCIGDFNG